MNNPPKNQIFTSKIVVFNQLAYFSASVSFAFGFVFTTFIALSAPTVAQAFTPSMTLLQMSGISFLSSSLNSPRTYPTCCPRPNSLPIPTRILA